MKSSKGMIVLLVGLAILSIATLVAMFFFFPKDSTKTGPTKPAQAVTPSTPAPLPGEFDPVEWTRNSQTPSLAPGAGSPGATGEQGITVTLPSEGNAPATSGPSSGVTFPSEAAPATPSTVESHPVNSPRPNVQVEKSTITATKTSRPVRKEPVKQVKPAGPEYWIQVASFKDRFQASNVEKALEQQSLKGTLTTATVNGVTVIRVRVGPYADKGEAEKFLAWIKPLKEFKDSYITRVGHP